MDPAEVLEPLLANRRQNVLLGQPPYRERLPLHDAVQDEDPVMATKPGELLGQEERDRRDRFPKTLANATWALSEEELNTALARMLEVAAERVAAAKGTTRVGRKPAATATTRAGSKPAASSPRGAKRTP